MVHPKPKRILYGSYWWLEDQMRCVARDAVARNWYLDFQMCVSTHLPEECGFGDPINLYRHFKRSLGRTPGEYRESTDSVL